MKIRLKTVNDEKIFILPQHGSSNREAEVNLIFFQGICGELRGVSEDYQRNLGAKNAKGRA